MKSIIVIVICVALLVGAGATGAALSAPADSLGLKSPGTASRISLAGTLLPFLVGLPLTGKEGSGSVLGGSLALGGILLGPSLGYFYGGCNRRGLIGIGVRVGLLAITGIAASQAEWPTIGVTSSGESGNAAAAITVAAGSALLVAAVVDLVQVSGTVRRANERRAHETAAMTPTLHRLSGSDGVAVGMKVRF